MASNESTTGTAAGSQVVGKVFVQYGTAKAVAADGTERALAPNSPIFAHDQIITDSDGSVSIMIDGHDGAPATQLDLGRMSHITIDEDVYAGAAPGVTADATAEADKIQQALLAGDQPIDLDATAAGGDAGAGGGVTSPFSLSLTGAEGQVGSGAGTTGPGYSGTGGGALQSDLNNAPVITSAAQVGVVSEGDPSHGVSMTATGLVTYTDLDAQDTHSFSLVGAEATHGTASVDQNGAWHYTVTDAGAVDALAAGQHMADSFTVQVADNNGGLVTQVVTIDIIGTNDAPVITSAAQLGVVSEGDPSHGVSMTATGLVTYTDVDTTDTHTFSLVGTAAAHGTASVDQNGAWHYTVTDAGAVDALAQGEHMADSFTVQVADHNGGLATQVVTIDIIGTNDAPVITSVAQFGAVSEGDGHPAADMTATGQVTFTDVDTTDTHTLSVLTDAAHKAAYGTASVDADGTWHYTVTDNGAVDALAKGQILSDSFTVQVDDHNGGIATQVVNIDITGTADVYAHPDIATVNEPIVGADLVVSGTYNVTIVLDTSGSMAGDKILLAKNAINNLLTEYGGVNGANAGNVHVLIVGFDDHTENSGWLSLGDAKAYVSDPSHLHAGGNTNYELALDTTITAFNALTPTADNNVLYFLSDGEPTIGGLHNGHHLASGDITTWEGFLTTHSMDAYAVGIGTHNAADQDLTAVAYSADHPITGPDAGANTPIIVTHAGDLDAALHTIVVPGGLTTSTINGDVSGNDTPIGATVTAIHYTGADGNGHDLSVAVDGDTTVATQLGVLTISADGHYHYTATHAVSADAYDVFTYTIADGDHPNDTSQSTLTITVDSLPEAHDVSAAVPDSHITIDTGHLMPDMVHITADVMGVAGATATLIHNGDAFGINSSVDGSGSSTAPGYSHEINYLGNGHSEVMSFELQNDAGEAAAGQIATHATVEINAFYADEAGVGHEVGSYALFNNGAPVGQGPTTFTAPEGSDGSYHLNITGPAGGFDEIRFSALPGTHQGTGGDSSDYNVKSVTFDLTSVKTGNLLADSTLPGHFGGDGGHVDSIAALHHDTGATIAGAGHSDTTFGDGLHVTGEYGGVLDVNPSTGVYTYTAPNHGTTTVEGHETFNFTLIDGDGDTSSAHLDMLIHHDPVLPG